ncbi:MAG: type II secretion system protein [Sedimentisphaerales bacterium]|nr:type II secretion system protein [Sedimentisphaerales bacterium]
MKTRNKKHGLSLMEMLIVVGIIAILATMVISVASRIDTRSKEKGTENLLTLLDSALQEYHEFTGYFPRQSETDFDNVLIHSEFLYGELNSIPTAQAILKKLNPSSIQNNYGTDESAFEIYDPWGTALDYRYITNDNFPFLISAGPDKTFGTADDINNK